MTLEEWAVAYELAYGKEQLSRPAVEGELAFLDRMAQEMYPQEWAQATKRHLIENLRGRIWHRLDLYYRGVVP